jgi:leucyl aminopeptidase
MTLDIKFASNPRKGVETAVLFIPEGMGLGPVGKALDKKSGGFISAFLKAEKSFTGKVGDSKMVTLPAGSGFRRAILIGGGKPRDFDPVVAENVGGKVFAGLEGAGATNHAAILAENFPGADQFLAHLAYGANLRAYKFLKYKTAKKEDNKAELTKLDIVFSGAEKAQRLYKPLANIAEAVYFARDLVNEPPNELYPDNFAKRIAAKLKPLGVEVEIIDEKKMARLGMGAALGVGQGSDFPPRMVVMRWNGKKDAKGPMAFVGKGITFDTGGVSIKPAAGMEEMKMDMGGAAAVTGLITALAMNKVKADVVGIVGLAENALSGRAYRPSDILKSYSGKTIEVLNTDAEGRLVLADALSYIQKTHKPRLIIDLATLTGAMMVALGHEYCGTFANDDGLWKNLEKASKVSGEKLWRMPLDEAWKKEMQGTITDLQNIGKGRYAGACTAAGFLEHFIEGKTKWAHLDIAGTAWVKADQPTVPKYGTGFGVRLLHQFVQDENA